MALGKALLAIYVDRGWVLRSCRSRIVHIMPTGRERFAKLFGA